jgi:hypothetical protein
MPNKCLQPRLRRKPMRPHRWLLPKLMPNSEEPVAMRAGALREGALLTVGWSILLAPVRRPTTSNGPHRQTGHGNGTGLPAQTGAATCASRIPIPCAGTGIKRRVKIERSSLLLFSAPLRRGFFSPLDTGAPGMRWMRRLAGGSVLPRYVSNDGPSYFPRLATEQAPARVVAIKIAHWGERWRTNRRFKFPACSTSAG